MPSIATGRKHGEEIFFMKISMRGRLAVCLCICAALGLTGCGWSGGRTRIVRVSHGQSETHPEHIGLLAFKAHVEQALGEKYEIQIFPNEILGASQKAIELTQTGAIDFVVAGTANLETFAKIYEIFSIRHVVVNTISYLLPNTEGQPYIDRSRRMPDKFCGNYANKKVWKL